MKSTTVVAALAATRLVRAWKYEVIGEQPRAALLKWLDKPVMLDIPPGHPEQVNVKATAAKEWAAELVDCPHCLGTWIAIGCSIGLRQRQLRPVIEGLAAAMILSMIVQWYPGFDFKESFPAVRIRLIGDEKAETREP